MMVLVSSSSSSSKSSNLLVVGWLMTTIIILITSSSSLVRKAHSFTILTNPSISRRAHNTIFAVTTTRYSYWSSPTTSITSRRRMSSSSTDDNNEFLNKVLQVAVDASKKAGELIMGNVDGGVDVSKCKANSRDLLTLIDPMCEKVIRETVLEQFPNHDFLGEEDVAPGKEASAAALNEKLNANMTTSSSSSTTSTPTASDDLLWIVDPIDGTTNFVHGIPICMPSIAATYKGNVLVGVIYDCHRDELFTAVRGRGAHMNGQPITVGPQSQIGDAIVAMGSPPGEESMKQSIKGVEALMPKVRTLRFLGSAAIMLAWIANGRLTAYWEYDLSSWDIAAGSLIIQEAGGKFTDLKGNDFDLRNRKICASNGGKVHDELLQILNGAGIE